MLNVTSSGPRPEIVPFTARGRVLNTIAGGSLALEAAPHPSAATASPTATRGAWAHGVGRHRFSSLVLGGDGIGQYAVGGSQRIPQCRRGRKRRDILDVKGLPP